MSTLLCVQDRNWAYISQMYKTTYAELLYVST